VFRGRFSPRRLRKHIASIDRGITQAARSDFYSSLQVDVRTEPDYIVITGFIECAGGIRVEVDERLRVLREPSWLSQRENPLVQPVFYRYNAVLLNRGTIFRYNSPHMDHRTFHHVHRFDVLGSGAETVDEVREQDVPSLRQVLKEAEEWHWANLNREQAAA
jgi:hypothetical protein